MTNNRRMKRGILTYLDKIHATPYPNPEKIDYFEIARNHNEHCILSMIELIIYTILQCPEKEIYIHRIMELDEAAQHQIMLFIQSILDNVENPLNRESPKCQVKESQSLRNERLKLMQKLEDLEKELEDVAIKKYQLSQENEELKLELTDLRNELSKKSPHSIIQADKEMISIEIESKITEKEQEITEMRSKLNESKRYYEAQITHLKDELDIANSRLYQLANAETTLERYKKQVEKNEIYKRKAHELERALDEMCKKLNHHSEQEMELMTLRQKEASLKEQLAKQNEKVKSAQYALVHKERQLEELIKKHTETQQTLQFYEERCKEFERDLEGMYREESSFDMDLQRKNTISGSLDDELKTIENTRIMRTDSIRLFRQMTINNEQVDSAIKAKKELAQEIENFKALYDILRERYQMASEDLLSREQIHLARISNLESALATTKDEIEILLESCENNMNSKDRIKELTEELEEIKHYRNKQIEEMKILYQEKNALVDKYIKTQEEVFVLKTENTNRVHDMKERDLQVNLLEMKVKQLEEKEKMAYNKIEELKAKGDSQITNELIQVQSNIKIATLENDNVSLSVIATQTRLKQKEDEILTLKLENKELIKSLRDEHQDTLTKHRGETELIIAEMKRQTEEAMIKMQQEKDNLVRKLQMTRSSTYRDFTSTMDLLSCTNNYSREIKKLKSDLFDKESEISSLKKAIEEHRNARVYYKKMVDRIMDELGVHTQQFNTAVLNSSRRSDFY
jgi:protein HOOK3